ncbi:MAG: CRISPR-associated protein Cas4 [Deltaproteobacteria bacterium RBG_16_49_23]|nr:MAG: CRISPR-associated protein Cas4 [Deltaproteobacteria bacterium RBG_16_49_23]
MFITPSDVIEYLYCPRFIYFMKCLDIPQHEDERYKVIKGREVHEEKSKINREYLRKKLGCVSKDISVYMTSSVLHLRGEVDEVLSFSDGTLAPLDYKFAEYKDWVFQTHKYQSTLYALLIMENYGNEVNRGYVCYIRSKNFIKEILFCNDDFEKGKSLIKEVLRIISKGYYPKKASSAAHCIDCCYRNICV